MKYFTALGGEKGEFSFVRREGRLFAVGPDQEQAIDLSLVGDGAFSLLVDGRSYDVLADVEGSKVTVQMLGERFVVVAEDERERAAQAVAGHKQGGRRELRASMPGVVVEVKASEGQTVAEGETLVVLEAMKMQNPLPAEAAGKVVRVLCRKGDAVAGGALLMELE